MVAQDEAFPPLSVVCSVCRSRVLAFLGRAGSRSRGLTGGLEEAMALGFPDDGAAFCRAHRPPERCERANTTERSRRRLHGCPQLPRPLSTLLLSQLPAGPVWRWSGCCVLGTAL